MVMINKVRGLVTASNLFEAGRVAARLQALHLRSSADLACNNLMCPKVGDPCICRLGRVLSRTSNLQHLDLSHNKLVNLPTEIWSLQYLRYLDLSGNHLESLPLGTNGLSKLTNLESLNLDGNPIEKDQEVMKILIAKGLIVGTG